MADKSFWAKFFRDAGLSADLSVKYSMIFVENRMTLQHLLHLTKDLLREMGITAVGDIITIIQHIKSVDIEKLSEAQISSVVSSTTQNSEKPIIPPGHELPVPVKRRVTKEIEGSYVVKLPEGKTEKTRQILQKLSKVQNNSTQVTRKVIFTSSSTAQEDYDEESDDDNFEVTISSTSPDFRLTNIRSSSGSGRSSVFDRLGAEVKSKRSPSPTDAKSIFSRFVNRSLAANSAEVSWPQSNFNNLKRSASESIFSRLGTSLNKSRRLENEDSLPYQGILKNTIPTSAGAKSMSDSFGTANPRLSPVSSTVSSQTVPRVSAKSRLGYLPSSNARRSAGIFGAGPSKNVHARLGKRSH
nr:Sterile alpha motif type [Hymenolepis microstoma]